MPNVFSDNFAATPSGAYDASHKVGANLSHARVRQKFMKVDIPVEATGLTITLGKFKSGDRLKKLELSTRDAAPGAGAINLGLYRVGVAFDMVPIAGNILDVDLFASAVAIATQLSDVDVLVEAGSVDAYHRNLALWEMYNLTDGSYASDPMEDWLLVATLSTGVTTAAAGCSFVADMVSFG